MISWLLALLVSSQVPYELLALVLDVKKGFDSLTHKILIGKLCHLGVRG